MMDPIRFYFSFRSHYSWLALHRIERALAGLPVHLSTIPCFPPARTEDEDTEEGSEDRYIREDVERFAHAYGLTLRWPQPFDTDWIRPHAAFLWAQNQGRGRDFALRAYALRFSEGRDIGADAVLAELAAQCALEAAQLLQAADDPKLQERVWAGMAEGGRLGLFGVPFFIFKDQQFWGNDRIEWLVRAIHQHLGRPVTDLCADPIARPFG